MPVERIVASREQNRLAAMLNKLDAVAWEIINKQAVRASTPMLAWPNQEALLEGWQVLLDPTDFAFDTSRVDWRAEQAKLVASEQINKMLHPRQGLQGFPESNRQVPGFLVRFPDKLGQLPLAVPIVFRLAVPVHETAGTISKHTVHIQEYFH